MCQPSTHPPHSFTQSHSERRVLAWPAGWHHSPRGPSLQPQFRLHAPAPLTSLMFRRGTGAHSCLRAFAPAVTCATVLSLGLISRLCPSLHSGLCSKFISSEKPSLTPSHQSLCALVDVSCGSDHDLMMLHFGLSASLTGTAGREGMNLTCQSRTRMRQVRHWPQGRNLQGISHPENQENSFFLSTLRGMWDISPPARK